MQTLPPLPVDDRTRIRRVAHRQRTERETLHAILDEALVAHLAVIRDGAPVVLPIGAARDGDSLLVHGSSGSRFFQQLAAGEPACITITHLDGLVYARSLFDSSMRYRAAVVHCVGAVVPAAEKEAALLVLSEHLMPGRPAEVRPMTKRELAATLVLRFPLDSASVKTNIDGVGEAADDGEDRGVWAGVLPLRVVAGPPETAPLTVGGTPVAASVLANEARLNAVRSPYPAGFPPK